MNEALEYSEASSQPTLEADTFYFESDCAALRTNADYSCLLKTLVLLEAQRAQACQDLERLVDVRDLALKSSTRPSEFVKHTLAKLDLPQRQKVYCLPQIDWSKYFDVTSGGGGGGGNNGGSGSGVDAETLEVIHAAANRSRRVQQQPGRYAVRKFNLFIRARLIITWSVQKESDPTKRVNYTPWTVEEQRRLEELLIEIPPEENEASRWRKIAVKLGTRTKLQVQSHCQKYFIKLAKAGLPIPGRMPNLRTYKPRKGTRGRVAAACGSGRDGLAGGTG